MMEIAKKVKAETTKTVDFAKVGRQIQSKLSRVEVPALTFSFAQMIDSYWNALWNGCILPFRLRIDGKVNKETLVGRLGFATTFIIADSIYLVGKFGVWILKKLPWKVNIWNVVMVAGLVVGFIGWGLPWFLDQTDFMKEIEQTKTIQALSEINLTIPEIPEVKMPSKWWALIPIVGMIPFSMMRFRKWRGVRSIGKRETEKEIGDP